MALDAEVDPRRDRAGVSARGDRDVALPGSRHRLGRVTMRLALLLAMLAAGCATPPTYFCVMVTLQPEHGAPAPALICRPVPPEIAK